MHSEEEEDKEEEHITSVSGSFKQTNETVRDKNFNFQ